jgi:ketosteroid isomerase-like protein
MSENLDLVRSIYADWGRGDFSRSDWADPEIELVSVDGPAPGAVKGLAEAGASWRSNLDAFENFRTVLEDCRQLDDERVLALTRFSGRGKRSGVELPEAWGRGAGLFHIREGKVIKGVNYDRDRALADLGLEG